MVEHLVKVCFPLGDQVATTLDVLADRWQHELRVDRAVALDQSQPEGGWDQLAAGVLHCYILPLDDVVDVSRDRCIGANPVLLHVRNQLRLSEVTRCAGLHVNTSK